VTTQPLSSREHYQAALRLLGVAEGAHEPAAVARRTRQRRRQVTGESLASCEVYGWADLMVDLTRLLDERGVDRRRWHDGEQTERIRVAAVELLAALGVEVNR
jgi:hypothetical protein